MYHGRKLHTIGLNCLIFLVDITLRIGYVICMFVAIKQERPSCGNAGGALLHVEAWQSGLLHRTYTPENPAGVQAIRVPWVRIPPPPHLVSAPSIGAVATDYRLPSIRSHPLSGAGRC